MTPAERGRALAAVVAVVAARADGEATAAAMADLDAPTLAGAFGAACGMLTAAVEAEGRLRGLTSEEALGAFLTSAGLAAAQMREGAAS